MAQVARPHDPRFISLGDRRMLVFYLAAVVLVFGFALWLANLQQQAVHNGNLTIHLIRQQCLDANASAKAFNSQNPPPAYQRPYRICG